MNANVEQEYRMSNVEVNGDATFKNLVIGHCVLAIRHLILSLTENTLFGEYFNTLFYTYYLNEKVGLCPRTEAFFGLALNLQSWYQH
jgi:hypothetical protein